MEQKPLVLLVEALKSIIQKECTIEEKIIRKAKKYGYIYFPKEFIGKKAKILIYDENTSGNIQAERQADSDDELLSESKDLV